MSILTSILLYFFVPYFAIAITMYAASIYILPKSVAHLAEFGARAMGYLMGLFICTIYGSIASIVLKLVGYGGLAQWTTAKSFKWIMYPLCGIWLDIEGDGKKRLEEIRPAVLVANHQTELDILFIAHVWPKYTSVTAKSDLKWYPFLGWFMYLSNTVFINRGNHSSALAAFESAAKHMKEEKQSVFIFPEGTRSYYSVPDLLPFKKGAFHLAVKAQVPIVPVVCANYGNILSFKKLYFHAGRIPVRVLKPVDTKGLGAADVEDLMKYVREEMLTALKELHAKPFVQNGNLTTDQKSQSGKVAMAS